MSRMIQFTIQNINGPFGVNKLLAIAVVVASASLLFPLCIMAVCFYSFVVSIHLFLPDFISRPLNHILIEGTLSKLGLS